jgi:hypothetical protein
MTDTLEDFGQGGTVLQRRAHGNRIILDAGSHPVFERGDLLTSQASEQAS